MHREDIIRNVERIKDEKVQYADHVVSYISEGKSNGKGKITDKDINKFLHSYEKEVRKQIKELDYATQENILDDDALEDRTIKYVTNQERKKQSIRKKH